MAEAQVNGKPAMMKNKKDLSLQIRNSKKKDHILEAQMKGLISTMSYTEAVRNMWCFMGKLGWPEYH